MGNKMLILERCPCHYLLLRPCPVDPNPQKVFVSITDLPLTTILSSRSPPDSLIMK